MLRLRRCRTRRDGLSAVPYRVSSIKSRKGHMQANDAQHHQVIIVGAGPGGLQLGYFLGCAGIDYCILERAPSAGSFFETYPVNRRLLSINKVNTGFEDSEKNLRWDWNSLISENLELLFGQYDQAFFPAADSFVRYLGEFCRQMRLQARFNCNVTSIERQGTLFKLSTALGEEFTSELLVISTGSPVPYTPEINGVGFAEQYGQHDRSVLSSKNKDILIIGKGNSAFETAEELLPYAARVHLISPSYLRWAWQTHFPGNLRQINSPFFETFLLKQQNAVLNGTIHSIERVNDKLAVSVSWSENSTCARLFYDRAILCTGFVMDTAPFAESARPDMAFNGKLPALTPRWESRNVPGLYFCGSLMQANDYKKSASAFIHGMRYNCQVLGRFLETRLTQRPYPTERVPMHAEQLFARMYRRIRRASSLWHLHGSLCDAYVSKLDDEHFEYFQDIPTRMLAETPSFSERARIELRFTFDNPRDPAEKDNFTPVGLLHPAIYYFSEGVLVDEYHMYEDIYGEWEEVDRWGPPFQERLSTFISALESAHGVLAH
jgi:thioredoxin reductase